MGIDQDDVVSPDTIGDWKTTRTLREPLPILVLLFTPITVTYDSFIYPTFSIYFLFWRLDLMNLPIIGTYFGLTISYAATFLVLSVPALIVSIFSSWMLRRLSYEKTTSRGVLMAMIGVTVVWAIFLSIFFFGSLSVGRFMGGPIPVPFGPLVAVLSRGYIMKLSEHIDELEKSD
ncbi:MAG: hypothetical protein KGD60_11510 [Candidatus Thorarchaeota archaeon]|nr:hypothetical protein [Candidatus Thorarchaeota archaeon]